MKIALYAPAILAGIFLFSLCLEGVESQGRGPPGGGGGKGRGGGGGGGGKGGGGGRGGGGGGVGRGPPMTRKPTNESETTITRNGKTVRKVSRSYTFTTGGSNGNGSDSMTDINISENLNKDGKTGRNAFNFDFGNWNTMNNMSMMNMTTMMINGLNGTNGKKNLTKPKLRSDSNKTAEELIAEFVGLVTEQFVRVGGDGMKQSGLLFKDAGVDSIHIIKDIFDIAKGKGKKGKKDGGGKGGKKGGKKGDKKGGKEGGKEGGKDGGKKKKKGLLG